MGKLTYDKSLKIDFDDRLLLHLQVVIGVKLRRGEAFYFSWKDDQRVGNGRTTIWLHPTIPLVFKYYGGRTAALNREWLTMLEHSANTAQGLQILDEPIASSPSTVEPA
jgi:hypothetical protein